MPEPRELTYLVPVDVLAEVNTAVAVLEIQGPAVTEALRQLGPGHHSGVEGREHGRGARRRAAARQARSVLNAAGMRPTGWCPHSTCQGRPPT